MLVAVLPLKRLLALLRDLSGWARILESVRWFLLIKSRGCEVASLVARLCWPLGLDPFGDDVAAAAVDRLGSGGVPADAPLLDDMRPETDRDSVPESEPWAEEE